MPDLPGRAATPRLTAEQIITAALVQRPDPAEVVGLLIDNGWTPPADGERTAPAPVAWRQAVDHDRHSDEPCARTCADEHWCYEGPDAFRPGHDPAAHGWQPLYAKAPDV